MATLIWLASLSAGLAQKFEDRWSIVFNSEARWNSWSTVAAPPSTSRTSGTQIYTPIALQAAGNIAPDVKAEFVLRGGYVDTKFVQPIRTVSVGTPTDTVLGSTFAYVGITGVQPFISFNVNLPTGTTVLRGFDFQARPEPDFAQLPTFGEGLNVGFSGGVNIPISPALMIALAGGYTSRGSFEREAFLIGDLLPGANGTIPLNPGDQTSVSTLIGYQQGRLSLRAAGSYTTETATIQGGTQLYRSGDRIFFASGGGYAWTENWSSRATGSYSHYAKNKIFDPVLLALITEQSNSNTNVYTAAFDTTYRTQSFAIGPVVSLLYRDNNSFIPTDLRFIPVKYRVSGGGMVEVYPWQHVALNARVEYQRFEEFARPAAPNNGFGSDGWLVVFGTTLRN